MGGAVRRLVMPICASLMRSATTTAHIHTGRMVMHGNVAVGLTRDANVANCAAPVGRFIR
jgi:hypothetical protein